MKVIQKMLRIFCVTCTQIIDLPADAFVWKSELFLSPLLINDDSQESKPSLEEPFSMQRGEPSLFGADDCRV
jgi:hypothetical protein